MKIWTQFKSAFGAMRHERASGGAGSNPFYQQFLNYLFGMFAGTRINYAQEVGDLTAFRLTIKFEHWQRSLNP